MQEKFDAVDRAGEIDIKNFEGRFLGASILV
jgi:hypothetical protein